ncbi:hypothetical protein SAMN05519104_8297 [Rhizobiales bacterium GAS188]|nr:hypothetical protein SAMN05519104_8297 [Rhizobiales bacterium GAS188]
MPFNVNVNGKAYASTSNFRQHLPLRYLCAHP